MSAHGLHKLIGGMKKREREMLTDASQHLCALPRHGASGVRAKGIVYSALMMPRYACEVCLKHGETHGYEVVRP